MEFASSRFIFFFTLSIFISSLSANIYDHPDEVWRRRAAEAMEATSEAYDPSPEDVTNHFNMQVHKFVEGNSTRRDLLEDGNKGECMATNPIDQCWRCQNNWADDRQKLVSCVQGFGHQTTGGKGGKIYVVNHTSDHDLVNPKPGTLRHAVIQKEPLWIIFAHDMNIKLSQELIMAGDKTIDGRGANVHIANGAGIMIQFVKNVIIHGIHFHNIVPASGGMIRDSVDHFGSRTSSDGDAISIFGSSNIWLDHLSMSQCRDGLIDAVQGSTAITISNCHFTKHDHVILLGANDNCVEDKKMQVTVAFNRFGPGLVQRMPRCRLGFFHVVNNDYIQWEMYAIGGSKNPTILSHGNRFLASDKKFFKGVTNRNYASYDEWKHWIWRSEGDLFLNGAFFNQSGDPTKTLQFNKKEMIQAKPGTFVESLTRFAGALTCSPGKKC